MLLPKLNYHRIKISCEEDLLTLYYFVNLAEKYIAAMSFPDPTSLYKEEDIILGEKAYNFIPKIIAVNGLAGYVVLEDGTIRCTSSCSSFIATFDECKESEITNVYSEMVK